MYKHFLNSVLMTVVFTMLLGLIYPLAITGISQLIFHEKANGQLIYIDGRLAGSRMIGQPFTGDRYFHSRPSAAGNGYDAANSGGSNLGPTNSKLLERINSEAAVLSRTKIEPVPVDLVTTSGSGLDPHITPAAAYYQLSRVAKSRGMSEEHLRKLVDEHIEARQLGVLGESRVNVLMLNLALDREPAR